MRYSQNIGRVLKVPSEAVAPHAAGARESRSSDLVSPAANAVKRDPRSEQEAGVAPAPEWRVEIEQLRAEVQALRERVWLLEDYGPVG